MRFLFILAFLIIAPLVISQNEWVLEKTEDDIEVYTRIKKGTNYYEFRVIFYANSSMKHAVDLIMNVNNFKNWMPNTLESKVLKKVDENTLYGYTITAAPWPASSRDLVFKLTKKSSNNGCSLLLVGKPDFYVTQSGKVRVQEYRAEWKLTELSPHRLKIDYNQSFNPGNAFPNWMVKNAFIDARMTTAKKFKEELKK